MLRKRNENANISEAPASSFPTMISAQGTPANPLDELCFEPANDTLAQFVLDQLFTETYNKNTVPSKRSATVVTIEFVIQNIAQTCELVIESYSYNAAKVALNWREWSPVFSIAKSKLADFTLYGLQWTKNSFEYAAGHWDQVWRCLGCIVLASSNDPGV
ncbi:hypothetical protein NECAME_07264 [Necator americanus]|uniref:Neurotransmitter-gated ion-channel ligand-binding domain-containing protein n=1 Tax=Necator americanus TaxID=51031 RepID=W2TRR6_NECAM|nr:hypothetical protein NECAME_07264 [Necator americanus]ETN83722.1 hypothetical protein NECAME_07264 [Necator americanus]